MNSDRLWSIVGVSGTLTPVLVAVAMAYINDAGQRDIIREWGMVFVALVAVSIAASIVSLIKSRGKRKLIGIVGVLVGLTAGCLVLFTYSFSFYKIN